MLLTEPILFLVTLYISLIYVLMNAPGGVPGCVLRQNTGVGSYPFIGMMKGEIAGGLYILLDAKWHN